MSDGISDGMSGFGLPDLPVSPDTRWVLRGGSIDGVARVAKGPALSPCQSVEVAPVQETSQERIEQAAQAMWDEWHRDVDAPWPVGGTETQDWLDMARAALEASGGLAAGRETAEDGPPPTATGSGSVSGDHIRAGDLMQSSLSRIVEWVDGDGRVGAYASYEVRMALIEGAGAVEEWTQARRGDARDSRAVARSAEASNPSSLGSGEAFDVWRCECGHGTTHPWRCNAAPKCRLCGGLMVRVRVEPVGEAR
jgi:hypothetical protein